jgi:hypothetical protein
MSGKYTSLFHCEALKISQIGIYWFESRAVAALWLSEAFRMSFCKLTLKLAVETVESWPVKELIAQSWPVKEQSACHFPMWYMPMH